MSDQPISDHKDPEHLKMLLSYAYDRALHQTRNHDWAQEAAAEVMAKLVARPTWPENERGWISAAILNCIIDRTRLKFERDRILQAQIPVKENPSGPDGALDEIIAGYVQAQRTSEYAFLRQLARDLEDQVSVKEWAVLMAAMDQCSNQEIADLLGYASAASVAQTLSRVRKKIRPYVSDWQFNRLS